MSFTHNVLFLVGWTDAFAVAHALRGHARMTPCCAIEQISCTIDRLPHD